MPSIVSGEAVKDGGSFLYLGSLIAKYGGTERDILARVGKTKGAFVMLKNIWSAKDITTNTKIRIFNSKVKTILLFRCKTWRTKKRGCTRYRLLSTAV